MTQENKSKKKFCIDDYDCIGFDMDHTMVQYKLPQTFKLLYKCVMEFLVKEKGHHEKYFNMDNFEKYEDFSLRGIVYDISLGNFVKLDSKGCILKCTHGMKEVPSDEVRKIYGDQMLWPKFDKLQTSIYHGDGYWIMENYFLVAIASILGLLVEEADDNNKSNGSIDYTYLHSEVIEALSLGFQPTSFKADKGGFFPAIKNDPGRYAKTCPASTVDWLKRLRKNGKVLFLVTDSYPDYMTHLMDYAMGNDWKQYFDFIIAHANKPSFFQEFHKKRLFLSVNDDLQESDKVPATDMLIKHTSYTYGSSWRLEKMCEKLTGKQNLKFVYFGDSIKSDIYPPRKHAKWDTVAVLEELEAEEVHFHKNNTQPSVNKKIKTNMLLNDEKLIVASNTWGSFFTHSCKSTDDEIKTLNTFWGDIIRTYSKICIPSIDYLADLPENERIASFSDDEWGFYPSAPRSLLSDDCQLNEN